ncbi:unnamed protein product [marine sediment metagenome]|uniref:Uncharacterized protein n=1 Tax=marine sediment metagenome TaxID=412755 RepID=X1GJ18_9ZZZZ
MEELAKKVDQIFNQFIQEELGNRLSQFGMKGLRDIVITEIKNYKPIKSEVKDNKAISK